MAERIMVKLALFMLFLTVLAILVAPHVPWIGD
jgi:hypothetical protein